MGKIVTEIKEINTSKDIYGPYARRKCQITVLENKIQKNVIYYLDENVILEMIDSYIYYLNQKKNNIYGKKKPLTTEERMAKNMKAAPFYSVGFVMILLSIFSSEIIGIPLLLGGAAVTILTASIVNNLGSLSKIKESPEYIDLENKIQDAEEFHKTAEYEIERKPNMDVARSKIEDNARNCKQNIVSKIAIQNAIDDLRYRAIRQKWQYYENRKRRNPDDDLKNDSNYYLIDYDTRRGK